VVVVDFWATWCEPCVASLPMVTAATDARKAQGVVFLGINDKETTDVIRAFQKEKALDFTVLRDTDGQVEAVHVGYDPNMKSKLGRQLDDILAGKSLLDATAAASPATGT
jgi:thiol-disulfide isomerase/thioredoxin